MDAIVFWPDKPFNPRLPSRPRRRGARSVVIRYRGSFGLSAIKALIVILLLAFMSSVIGERPSQSLGANEVASKAGASIPQR
jgi:hypothetical protein